MSPHEGVPSSTGSWLRGLGGGLDVRLVSQVDVSGTYFLTHSQVLQCRRSQGLCLKLVAGNSHIAMLPSFSLAFHRQLGPQGHQGCSCEGSCTFERVVLQGTSPRTRRAHTEHLESHIEVADFTRLVIGRLVGHAVIRLSRTLLLPSISDVG